MNRKLTTAGLAILGAASMVPSSAQSMSGDQKPWSVSAQLRAFYDDNYLTFPKALRNRPGFDDNTLGFDLSPSASYNLHREQTDVGASYLYTMRYYADRKDEHFDHSHQINLKASQIFSERYSADVKDSFVIAQEPSIIDPNINTTIPARSEGNNIRNQAGVNFSANLLEHFGLALGYNNTIYDYEQAQEDVVADQTAFNNDPSNPVKLPVNGVGSRSAVLDRVEHAISIDGNYQVLPKTTLSLGYVFTITDYTSRDRLAAVPGSTTVFYPGEVRDSKSHAVTLGARQQLNDQFSVSGKVGVQITTYDREDLFDDETGPYAEASASWNYTRGSSLQFGLRHMRTPTDVRQTPTGGLTADAETTSIFASVAHEIAPKLLVNLMAQYQHATFNDQTGTDVADDLFYGGVNLTYQFTKNLSAELGYTYDRLDSDIAFGPIGRSFTRNRVYLGGRVTY